MTPLLVACSTQAPDAAPRRPAATAALVNGSFARRLEGWETSGDGRTFQLFEDPVSGRTALTTFTGGADGSAAKGVVAQAFTVPDDAVALRFLVHGGRSHVRLYDATGSVVEQAIGMNDNTVRIPVSWELLSLRDTTVRLAIEDEQEGPWGFVSVSGFDVLRDRPCALANGDFSDGLNGWDRAGDAGSFHVFRDELVGGRMSVTTASRDGPRDLDAAIGRLSQGFLVPDDGVALRFFVHGGRRAFVRLRDEAGGLIRQAAGEDSNTVRVPVSWDLAAHAGRRLVLTIEDDVAEGPWGFVGCSSFDLVTLSNGP